MGRKFCRWKITRRSCIADDTDKFRWMIAIVCLLPMVWFKEKKILPPRTAILPLILMGISGVALFNIFQFLALEKTSATNVGLISTLNAISIALFSVLFLRKSKYTSNPIHDSFILRGYPRPIKR